VAPQPAATAPTLSRKALLKAVLDTLEDYKGQDIVVLDIAKQSSFADDMVIVTGTSTRHIASMADALTENHKPHLMGQEGSGTEWVCTDLGGIVVHLFTADKRALYNLEKLWSYHFTE
jgi:ribosome-associated protein